MKEIFFNFEINFIKNNYDIFYSDLPFRFFDYIGFRVLYDERNLKELTIIIDGISFIDLFNDFF